MNSIKCFKTYKFELSHKIIGKFLLEEDKVCATSKFLIYYKTNLNAT